MQFRLGYRMDGFGLGYSPTEIEAMPVAQIHWFLNRLAEQHEAEKAAVQAAIAEAKKGRR
jgi:hypothetical protein